MPVKNIEEILRGKMNPDLEARFKELAIPTGPFTENDVTEADDLETQFKELGTGVAAGSPDLETQFKKLGRVVDIDTLNDYCFISNFDVEPDKARQIVKVLRHKFGVKDFQFYDCMERYERPIDLCKSEWTNPMGLKVRRDTVDAYIDEIAKCGGRSWMLTSVYGVSPGETFVGEDEALFFKRDGEFVRAAFPDVDNVFMWLTDPGSERWKEQYSQNVVDAVKTLGFSGVHFEQIGYMDEMIVIREKGQYHDVSLPQRINEFIQFFADEGGDIPFTFNAVYDYAFEETIGFVQFPYVALWSDSSDNALLEQMCNKLRAWDRFVIGVNLPFIDGNYDFDALNERVRIINEKGGTAFFQGDDGNVLVSGYAPSAQKSTE